VTAPFIARIDSDGVVIRVKAVPGAKSDAIVGVLGDGLKIRVAAPPEAGRANDAIVRTLADALGIARRAVEVVAGHGSPAKLMRLRGVSPERLDSLTNLRPTDSPGEMRRRRAPEAVASPPRAKPPRGRARPPR